MSAARTRTVQSLSSAPPAVAPEPNVGSLSARYVPCRKRTGRVACTPSASGPIVGGNSPARRGYVIGGNAPLAGSRADGAPLARSR